MEAEKWGWNWGRRNRQKYINVSFSGYNLFSLKYFSDYLNKICPFYDDLAAVLKTSERAVLAEINSTQNTNIKGPVILIIEESTESVGGLPKPPKIAAKTTKRSSILEDFVAVKKEGNKLLKLKLKF